jgi:UDP-4-amino-4,6-dideoxy-N-acetyl-beta-L-altrosamine transaminase
MNGFLPYAQQVIEDDDIAAVEAVLRGNWLTTGPKVEAFEAALAKTVHAKHAIVCNSGTAALYIAARAAGLAPGDTVIVPSVTFLATASANVLAGLEVVFADVDPDTGLMTVDHAAEALRRGGISVKAVFPVHLGGRVENSLVLKTFADSKGLLVIEDACHALGTYYGNAVHPVGGCNHSLAACFSFHPAKTIAMGEGGAVTTNSGEVAHQARLIRNHGMTRDANEFVNQDMAFSAQGDANPWYYEASEISHNFRASDINCALGLSQLSKLETFLVERRKLAALYETQLAKLAPLVRYVPGAPGDQHGWHLCTVLIDFPALGLDRRELMEKLKARGVGSQVHYIPVHAQPFYRRRYGEQDLPGAMRYYERTLSLPLFPSMTAQNVHHVVNALAESLNLSVSA